MSMMTDIMSQIFQPNQAKPIPSPMAMPAEAAPMAPISPAAQQQAQPANAVDVDAVLTGMANQKGEKLNWQTSIVDLLKLLGLDSSLASRKQLAQELNYTGDTNDSAAMNLWLQKQVMQKLAANGGHVPKELMS